MVSLWELQLSPSELSTAVRIASQGPRKNDLRMWREYAEATLFNVSSLQPNHMAFIANGFARAQVPDREVFNRMSDQAFRQVDHFEPRDTALFLNAYAKLQFRDKALFKVFSKAIQRSSSVGYGEQQLSLLCNAYARLEIFTEKTAAAAVSPNFPPPTAVPLMALGGLQEVIDQYVDADVVTEELREVTLKKVIAGLDEKRLELLDIVVHLEKVMCDASNPTGRRNAIQFLAFCLRDKAELKLNFKHVETFAKFFENKLSDWQCVEGAVLGIYVLLKRQAALIRTLKQETENGEMPLAVHLADKMLKEVHVPSHTQAVRKSVLDTILLLEDEWRSFGLVKNGCSGLANSIQKIPNKPDEGRVKCTHQKNGRDFNGFLLIWDVDVLKIQRKNRRFDCQMGHGSSLL
eukprot:symbB.v1.2.000874.t1/scaffold38.1/size396883/14